MAPPERRAPRPFDHDSGRDSGGERLTQGHSTHQEDTELLLARDRTLNRGDSGNPDIEDIKAHSLVPTRQDPFQVMDSWDDEVIIHELKGQGPKGKLVYSFRQGNTTVVGLGKEGVDFCCQLLLSQGQVIRELDLSHVIIGEKEDREALFTSKAGRFAVGSRGEMALDTVIATKRQPLYNLEKSTGELVLNPHWFEQGSQKALRNARIRLLPIALREYVISLSNATGRTQSNTQQKLADPNREASTDEQRKLYASLLASHHVTADEREKALSWLAEKRHSKATLTKQIDALATLVQTRTEAERLVKLTHGLPE